MSFLQFGLFSLFSYCSVFVLADLEFETEKYIPNRPTTILSCTQRHKHLHIFDALQLSSLCERLHSNCREGSTYRTDITEHPHMAVLGWYKNPDEIDWDCGGVLITENFVMTTATCTFSKTYRSAPKYVRLGDLRIASEIQSFDVIQIFINPEYQSSTIGDIALIKLDRKVKMTKFVLPACLWPTYDFNFDEMNAVGWEADNFGGKQSRVLKKSSLKAVSNVECNKHSSERYSTMDDLKDTQLCTDSICQNYPGGSLEKTIFIKELPISFVLGLVSFENGCEANIPGVVTRVSSYIPWIESVVEKMMNPLVCSTLHIDFTAEQPSSKIDHSIFDFSVTLTNEKDPSNKCVGSVIDKQYVLTSASCINRIVDGPNTVNFENRQTIRIASKFVHPMNDGFNNDLALVKLERKIRFENMNQLICPAPYNFKLQNYKQNYFSSGDLTLNHYLAQSSVLDLQTSKVDSKIKNYFYIKSRLFEAAHCANLVVRKFYFSEIDNATQICVGNDPFAVPEFCKSIPGGALLMEGLYRRSDLATNRIPYLVGVQSFGEDCGFGLPNVYARVAAFIPWVDSVLHPDGKIAKNNVANLEIAEEYAKCIGSYSQEDRRYYDSYIEYPRHKLNPFCRKDFKKTAYCVKRKNETEIKKIEYEIEFDSLVLISNNIYFWLCDGIIIKENLILTTARCVKSIGKSIIQLLLSPSHKKKVIEAKQHHIHPDYSAETGLNDVALIVTDPLDFYDTFVPACLWYNTTHLPFDLQKFLLKRNTEDIVSLDMNPLYNEDCSEYFEGTHTIAETEFCATINMEYRNPSCDKTHSRNIQLATLCSTKCEKQHGEIMLHHAKHMGRVWTVVVGLSSRKNYCDLDKPLVFARVSAYKTWIETTSKLYTVDKKSQIKM